VLLLVAGCRSAAPTLEIEVFPTDDAIYVVSAEPGFEDFNLAVQASGPFDHLQLEVRSAGAVVETIGFGKAALAAHTRNGRVEGLQPRLPAALAADSVGITISRDGRTVAARTVPLTRYQQHNRFRLPLEGCWFVSSGYDFGVEHRRWYSRAHFAWDFVRIDDTGKPAAGTGARADEYFAFGQPIVAPADGVVLFAEDRHPDNVPGVVGKKEHSNYLLIDHGHDEHSKLAHLMQGSLQVRAGERVVAGQVLGKVGNSGMSDGPHLHFHFQQTKRDANGVVVAEPPIPALLSGYRSTSNRGVARLVDIGRPRRGEFVCSEE